MCTRTAHVAVCGSAACLLSQYGCSPGDSPLRGCQGRDYPPSQSVSLAMTEQVREVVPCAIHLVRGPQWLQELGVVHASRREEVREGRRLVNFAYYKRMTSTPTKNKFKHYPSVSLEQFCAVCGMCVCMWYVCMHVVCVYACGMCVCMWYVCMHVVCVHIHVHVCQ